MFVPRVETNAVESDWLILAIQIQATCSGKSIKTFSSSNISRNYQIMKLTKKIFFRVTEVWPGRKTFRKMASAENFFLNFGYFGQQFYLLEVFVICLFRKMASAEYFFS